MKATCVAVTFMMLATAPMVRESVAADAQGVAQVPSRSVSDSGEKSGARRIPWLAGVLGIHPGLGHVYAGEPGRGLVIAGVWLGSGMVAFSSANKVVTGTAGVVLIGASVYGIADAALATERFNRRHARTANRAASAPTARGQ